MVYSDAFFDTTATIGAKVTGDVLPLLSELQMIRSSFERAEYPFFVSAARAHLLSSMAEVVLSFRAFMAGEPETARIYMRAAQDYLEHMHDEVDRLGLPQSPPTPTLH